MANYQDISSMVRTYYDEISANPSSDPITRAADTSTSDCGVNNSISQISNMSVVKSMNGTVRGYQYIVGFNNPKTSGDSTPSNFDSTAHVPFGKATGGGGSSRGGGAGRYPGGWGAGSNRGNNHVYIPATKSENGFVSGLKKANNTIGKVVGTVIGGSWAAAAAIAKFGIDQTKEFYKGVKDGANKAWNKVFNNGKENHPDDYSSLYNEDEYGNPTVSAVFEFNDDGSVTMYLPDDVIADIYRNMRDTNLLNPERLPQQMSYSDLVTLYPQPISTAPSSIDLFSGGQTKETATGWTHLSFPADVAISVGTGNGMIYYVIFSSSYTSSAVRWTQTTYIKRNDQWEATSTTTEINDLSRSYTYNGKTVYYSTGSSGFSKSYYGGTINYGIKKIFDGPSAWVLCYGNATGGGSTIPGISKNPTSTFFDPSVITANDIPTIIQQMNDNYAPQMGSPLTATVMNDSCNEVNINYHPVSFPITVGVGDLFPISPSFYFGGNPGYDPQSNPKVGPGFSIDPSGIFGSLLDLLKLLTSFELPDIKDLLSLFTDAKDILDLILKIIAELTQGASGGSGLSIDPEINITTNNYYEDHDPEDPDTPLPPINVNPPEVVVNVNPEINIQPSPTPTPTPSIPAPNIVIQPNITLPDPTIPIIIPPWPQRSDEPVTPEVEGFATALWNVYNPSQGAVNAFGAWLWNPNFIDVIKRLFESPIDAVFTLHKVFVNPTIGGTANIVVGSIDSGVSSAVVTSQYTNLDCGSIDLDEYFGNVFDYAPYTILQLYLPFIGIVELDPAYCMRSSISVFYTVDVFTGACVAKVGCKRDGYDICIYEFTGSCSVEYPVSYHSYSSIAAGILSGAISATAGAIGTYVTGNPMAAVYGASSGIHQSLSGRSEIRHSGSFAGSHGAMGIRKPYLIISRPILELADDFAYFDGYPANQTVSVGSCAGYIKAKECHLNVPNAYKSELDELDAIFKSGVIVS